MKYIKLSFSILTVGILYLLIGCNLSPYSSTTPLFNGTTNITCTSPLLLATDAYPDFKWSSPGTKYQVVGVFSSPIKVSGKQILNKDDCFAMWTTDMTGSAGSVNYANFKKVIKGEIQKEDAPTLVSGTTYYWGVWGYSDGLTIVCSSEGNQFKAF